jgi:hypothetical protein
MALKSEKNGKKTTFCGVTHLLVCDVISHVFEVAEAENDDGLTLFSTSLGLYRLCTFFGGKNPNF